MNDESGVRFPMNDMGTKDAVPVGAPALRLHDVSAGYGRFKVLDNVSLNVGTSQIVALLGANGAGKTTTLRAAAGLVQVTAGEVSLSGVSVTGRRPEWRVRRGLCLVPEGRGIFKSLTVRENLMLQVPAWSHDQTIGPALDAFPALSSRLSQVAGSMSGGQQQMLALARAFLSSPQVVMLDEVSLGLAPLVVDEIFEALASLASKGASILIVEQYVHRVMQFADYVYVLNKGQVAWHGRAADLGEEELKAAYFGTPTPTASAIEPD